MARLQAEWEQVAVGSPTGWPGRRFVELADEWLENQQAFVSRQRFLLVRTYTQHLITHLHTSYRPALTVAEIGIEHIESYHRYLKAKGHGPTTIHSELTAFQAIFGWAEKTGLVDKNPLRRYERKPRPRRRERVPSDDETTKLLAAAHPTLAWLLQVAAATGCRPGELRQLRWSGVELAESPALVWPVHKTVEQQTDPVPRIVPVPPAIVAELRRRQQELQPAADDYVFLNAAGRPWTKDALAVRRTRLRAGVAGVTAYGLRHKFATDHLGKVSDYELAEHLGHTDPSTLKHYYHTSRQRKHEIGKRLWQQKTTRIANKAGSDVSQMPQRNASHWLSTSPRILQRC